MDFCSKNVYGEGISVVIPAYNAGKYLPCLLNSLKDQVYKTFEVVIINDGSNDNTDEIVNEWMIKGELNINYTKQENAGVSVARNNGIKKAVFSLIVFIDADDLVSPYYLSRLRDAIGDSDSACCFLSRKSDDLQKTEPTPGRCSASTKSCGVALNYIVSRLDRIGFYCQLYRKELLDKYNISFPVGRKYGEDREFQWRYLLNCKSISFIDDVLYFYADNPDGAINQRKTIGLETLDHVRLLREAFMDKMNDVEVVDFLDKWEAIVHWSFLKNCVKLRKDYMFYSVAKLDRTTRLMRVFLSWGKIAYRISAAIFLLSPRLFYILIRIVM